MPDSGYGACGHQRHHPRAADPPYLLVDYPHADREGCHFRENDLFFAGQFGDRYHQQDHCQGEKVSFLFVGSANSRVSGGRMFIAVFFGNDCKGNHFRPNGTFFPQRRVALSRKMRFYRRIMLIFTTGKQQPYGLQRYHPSERSRRDDQQLSCRSGAAPGPEPV